MGSTAVKLLSCTVIISLCAIAALQAGEKPAAGKDAGFITGVTIGNEGRSGLVDVPVTFGHIFKPGDIPAGTGIAARFEDGRDVPLQLDAKATHREGSLRHAVLTLKLPALPAGTQTVVNLVRVPAVSGGATVKPDELLATGYDVKVTVTLSNEVYTASSKEALELVKTNGSRVWLAGPLVGEWIAAIPLKKADGVAHPHLTARFNVRAYAGGKTARTDVCIENCWAYEPNPSGFRYDVTISTGGRTVYEKKALAHTHHARWHRQYWTGLETEPTVKHDIDYLISTKAVPNYDRSVKVLASVIEKLPQEYEPMSNGGLSQYMPNTGAHPDIGPFPHSASVYVLTMDPRARRSMMADGGCGGSYQIHYRDRNKDMPVSIDDYPYMTLMGNPGDTINRQTKKAEAFPKVTNPLNHLVPDEAHEPSIAFLPYAVSGDYYQLEELQFWAGWNLLQLNPGFRQREKGIIVGQLRAIAWSMRTLGHAAYITPDGHPLKKSFEEKLQNNIAAMNRDYPGDTNYVKHANALGVYTKANLDGGFGRPWMDDFLTWTIGYLVDLGYEEARPMLMYKVKFVVGRMTPPYCWQHASVYTTKGRDANGKWFTNFGDYYKANFTNEPSGLVMDSFPGMEYGLGANMQPALATAVDAGAPGAREAWERYETRNPRQPYEKSPVWAIVPRSR